MDREKLGSSWGFSLKHPLWRAALYATELRKQISIGKVEIDFSDLSQMSTKLILCSISVTGSGTKGTRKIIFSAWGVHGPVGVPRTFAGVPDRDFAMRDYWD